MRLNDAVDSIGLMMMTNANGVYDRRSQTTTFETKTTAIREYTKYTSGVFFRLLADRLGKVMLFVSHTQHIGI